MKTAFQKDFGVGIRIFKGFNSVYAYTNQHDKDALIDTAIKASGGNMWC